MKKVQKESMKTITCFERTMIDRTCILPLKEKWLTADDSFPDFLHEVPDETKNTNERYLRSAIDDFRRQTSSMPINPFKRKIWRQQTMTVLEKILREESILDIHRFMDPLRIRAFQSELMTFFRLVRNFAPELTFEGIGQAIRNYTVYGMFKEINRTDTGFSMPAFGYSMLYPFTDNFIDNPECSDIEKQEFNKLIRHQIEGREVRPKTPHQIKTCRLLRMALSEYPKENNPSSSQQLLLMMLDAQEESLRQHNSLASLTGDECLDISLFKGGISVLIDRFFVDKDITEEDLRFYFGFGFFLQLADDLQDIGSDKERHGCTLFTTNGNDGREDRIVNKMFHFIHRIEEEYHAENEPFKEFIIQSSYLLLCTSLFQSRKFFSRDYLDRMERIFPISYAFLGMMKQDRLESAGAKTLQKYMKMLDVLVS